MQVALTQLITSASGWVRGLSEPEALLLLGGLFLVLSSVTVRKRVLSGTNRSASEGARGAIGDAALVANQR